MDDQAFLFSANQVLFQDLLKEYQGQGDRHQENQTGRLQNRAGMNCLPLWFLIQVQMLWHRLPYRQNQHRLLKHHMKYVLGFLSFFTHNFYLLSLSVSMLPAFCLYFIFSGFQFKAEQTAMYHLF